MTPFSLRLLRVGDAETVASVLRVLPGCTVGHGRTIISEKTGGRLVDWNPRGEHGHVYGVVTDIGLLVLRALVAGLPGPNHLQVTE